ncbi:MAG TPA: YhcN/YlaJ family sporulation lipoprotein [Cerasibacillus sp.]|uniref:YhcN/YlaJ family sporulation lipoprotein n=1 Tax=Cerasibacillus sp. TaxID=2498711 RepID=UPI002F410AE8
MRQLMILLIVLSCAACSSPNQHENAVKNNNTQPIHFETKEQQKGRLGVREKSIGEQGGYPQSYRNFNKGPDKGPYTDIFTNDESAKLEEHLRTFKEVKQAQVASTEDRIVIGVILSNRFQEDPNIATDIKRSVEEMFPNKTIIVYTDHIHWDRMRELRSKNIDNPETLFDNWFGD